MGKKHVSASLFVFTLLLVLMSTFLTNSVQSWSNGGYSADPSNPDYGTHDWIAQHALDWLPTEEKQYISENLVTYLYGTELPDNNQAADGIGDTTKHHIYYNSFEVMTDDAAAVRASTEYTATLNFLKARDYANAAKNAGTMSHYIVDLAVFGHVMGAITDWGAEVHHTDDYEPYVQAQTSSYSGGGFDSYLSFDGSLTTITAYDAAKDLAYDTTFDVDGELNCTWMDQNYDWSNPTFKNRAGESLNLAVNYLSDVLHSLYLEAATVHNVNTGEDFWTIQAAINDPDTLNGHTILVDSGVYDEHVVVDKTLALVGENRSTTIIDGGNVYQYVVEVRANSVNITGFTIRNSAQTGVSVGVYLVQANNSWVSDDNIVNNSVGIQLDYSSHNRIESNNVSLNSNYGIQLFESSDFNIITKNEVVSNLDGIEILHSSHNVISENVFRSNLIDGMRLYASGGVTGNNTITGNTVSENQGHGIALYYASSSSNRIFHNNFENNSIQAFTSEATNTWDNDYSSGGNYWSDYAGVDNKKGSSQDQAGSDGIGDTPRIIDQNNRDRFPLVHPYLWPDLTPPTTADNYDKLWHTTDFTINLTATDVGGVNETYYKLNDGLRRSISVDGQPRITTESASNKLEYWSIDTAGNEELPHNVITEIKLDKTVPSGSIKINNNAAYASSLSVTLTLNATDATSGVYQVRFSNDDVWDTETWETPSSTKTWTLLSEDGTKTVYYQVRDNAGLVSTYSDSIVLDTTQPTANAGTDQTITVGSTATFNASSSHDNTGISSYEWDFGDDSSGRGSTTTHTYTQAGTYNVSLTVKDSAGNTSTDTLTVTVVTSTEAVPMWAIGAAAFIIVVIAIGAVISKRRPKLL